MMAKYTATQGTLDAWTDVSNHCFPSFSLLSCVFHIFKIYMPIYLDKLNLNKLNTLAGFEGAIYELKQKLLLSSPPFLRSLPPHSQVLGAILCVYPCVQVPVHNCVLCQLKMVLSFTSGSIWCNHDNTTVFPFTLPLRNCRALMKGFELPQSKEVVKKD